MPSFIIEEKEAPSFSRITEPGNYKVTITKAELKAGGEKPYFQLRLEDGAMGEEGGASILDRLYLTKESKWRVEEVLRAIGAIKLGDKGKKLDLQSTTFEGGVICIEVAKSKRVDANGDPYLEVHSFWPLNGENPRPRNGKKAEAAPKTEPKAESKPSDDDEISL